MAPPLWSVVVIGRNEAKTFPRLVASLKEFRDRGGEVILCDTGSTDGTADVARGLGCTVSEQGTRFITTISAALAKQINRRFIAGDELPIVHEGDKLFDYSAARNFAASLSKTDMVSMPDCDEIWTKLDIDRINAAIESGAGQLEYNFVFAHDQFGGESVKFMHSKFYSKSRQHWVGIIHEVLSGDAKRQFLDESVMKLEHFQNVDTSRKGYLTGLALDCFEHPEADRNSHYFARELFWNQRPRSALREFQRHVAMNRWPAERAESMIYIGDCYQMLGEPDKALKAYHNAIQIDGGRRKAWIRLAEFFYGRGDAQRTACYAMAALQIAWNGGFYANDMAHYQHHPHEMLYWALWFIGEKEASKVHWRKALGYRPTSFKYLNAAVFYDEITPTLAELTQKIRDGGNFGFVKLGDGEQACMDGKEGATCDGQPYSPELRNSLHQAYEILRDRVYVLEFKNQPSYNLLLHRKGNDLKAVAKFWTAVRESKRGKAIISPATLVEAATFLGATHLAVDEHNAFSCLERIKFCLELEVTRGTSIFIFCAGPASKVWIADLMRNHHDITCIDAGSAFDPLFVGQTRTEQITMEEAHRLYAEP
jgi:glycosyltransferase involved in cell wall biosynthesis